MIDKIHYICIWICFVIAIILSLFDKNLDAIVFMTLAIFMRIGNNSGDD